MTGCRILLYEVNHPLYPNLLVDVSGHIEVLTSAIDAHASQLELHNYREAALGMRHYRALSLPAAVKAAEGYREIRLLGSRHPQPEQPGPPASVVFPNTPNVHDGPLVSVMVRTKDRPDLLAEALESIANSTYRRVEVVLVNDGGAAAEAAPRLPVSHRCRSKWGPIRGGQQQQTPASMPPPASICASLTTTTSWNPNI